MSNGPASQPDSDISPLPAARTIAAWRLLLRGAGVLIGLFIFCFWAAKGYNRGWTQDQVPVRQIDPITEIEYVARYEKRFVPGVDFLAAGIFAGLVIFAVTFIPGRSRKAV